MSRSTTSDRTDVQPPETVFGLLSNRRRRHALAFLSERDSAVSLDELADAVASAATSPETDGSSGEPCDRVAVALHHAHLPKLADAGVVSYDAETNTVTPERIETVAPYLADERDGASSPGGDERP